MQIAPPNPPDKERPFLPGLKRPGHPGPTSVIILSGLALLLLISFCLSACGSTPADHPLTLGTPGSDQGSPTAGTGNSGIPIVLKNDQSSLTTYPGGFMTMTISTSPYAVCNFIVYYGLTTPSKTYGIVPRTADANGIATWKWQVDGKAHTGTWPLSISATLPSGAHSTTQVDVYVSLPPINVVSSQSILSGPAKSDMKLTIQTAPSVSCALLLNFGPGFDMKTLKAPAGGAGIAIWTWHVNDHANPGVFPLTVTVTLADGESTSIQVNMTITP